VIWNAVLHPIWYEMLYWPPCDMRCYITHHEIRDAVLRPMRYKI
jgi:hypothetical protein